MNSSSFEITSKLPMSPDRPGTPNNTTTPTHSDEQPPPYKHAILLSTIEPFRNLEKASKPPAKSEYAPGSQNHQPTTSITPEGSRDNLKDSYQPRLKTMLLLPILLNFMYLVACIYLITIKFDFNSVIRPEMTDIFDYTECATVGLAVHLLLNIGLLASGVYDENERKRIPFKVKVAVFCMMMSNLLGLFVNHVLLGVRGVRHISWE